MTLAVTGTLTASLLLAQPAWAATIPVNTTTDELNVDGDCSLREAVQAANTNAVVDACPAGSGTDTITMPSGTYTLTLAGANENSNATGDLDTTDPAGLIINGSIGLGFPIINANNIDRAFQSIAGPLTLAYMSVRSGNVVGDGGAVNAAGALTLTSVTLSSNEATGSGGGIYFSSLGDTVIITRSSFISNISGQFGGGMRAIYGANVQNSYFANNKAQFGGGLSADDTLVMTSTTFRINTASIEGGGLHNDFSLPVRVVNSLFDGNSAPLGAAMDFVSTADVTLIHNTIASPTVASSAAIRVTSGLVNITNTLIASHTVGIIQSGGTVNENFNLFSDVTTPYAGIINSGGNSITGTAAFVDSATNDYHLGEGSAAFNTGTSVNATVTTDFEDQSRPYNGSVPDIGYDERTIDAASMCFAKNNISGLDTVYGTTNARAVQFALNAASNYAGVVIDIAGTCAGVQALPGITQTVYLTMGTQIILRGGFTTTNWTTAFPLTQPTTLDAQGGGRVIYTLNDSTVLQNLTVQNGAAIADGGGIYAPIGDVSLTNVKVLSNTTTTGFGGGVRANDVTLNGGLFLRNTASSGPGGGVYAVSDLNLTDTQFISNTAGSSFGGGGAAVQGTTTLNGGLFQDNTSSGFGGGGLYAFTTLTLTNTQFLGNIATGGGPTGGGANAEGMVILNGGLFQNNAIVNGSGGGIYAKGVLILTGTQFLSNTATSGGGANAFTGTLNGGLFQSNNATSTAGGLFVRAGTLSGTQFLSNTSTGSGGGAEVYAGTLNGGLFQGNRAGLGALSTGSSVSSSVTVTGTQFINNTGTSSGGGLFHNNGSLQVKNALFAGNTSTAGSAIYLAFASGDVQILQTTITSPTLANGSAIFSDRKSGTTVGISNTIIANHATGIARNGSGDSVFENYNLFFGNTANKSGTFVVGSGVNDATGNPAFANPAGGDYHLTAASAAINSGANVGVATDFELEARPQNGGFDIGYDESPFSEVPISGLSAINNSPKVVNTAVNFTATVSAGSNVAYTWNFGDGTPTASGVIASHTYATVGNYTAIVTATNGLGSVAATTPVTITNTPIAGLAATNNSPKLVGSAVTLTATISAGTNVTYTWNFGDGTPTANGAIVIHSYAMGGFYAVIVTATNGAGTAVATTFVTINSAGDTPIAGLSATNNSPKLAGSVVDLTATISSGSNVSYIWNFGDGTPTFGGATTSHSYATAGTYTAIVTATNGAGTTVATTLVTINSLNDTPIAGLTATNNSPKVAGSAVTLTATITSGTNVAYIWNFGDGTPLAIGPTTSHSYATAGTYTATVTASNGAGTAVATTLVTIVAPTPTFSGKLFMPTLIKAIVIAATNAPTMTAYSNTPLATTARGLVGLSKTFYVHVHDSDSPLNTLQLSAASSNQAVVSSANLQVHLDTLDTFATPPDASFSVIYTPTQPGSTNLVLTAKDNSGAQTNHTVNLTVVAANTAPTVSPIADRTGRVGVPLTVNFTVNDAEGDALTVDGESSQGSNTIVFGGSGANRSVVFTPDETGTATIYVYASDGIATTSVNFDITVAP